MVKIFVCALALCALCALCANFSSAFSPAHGGEGATGTDRPAIVLAAFGTTEPGAVDSILNIKRRVTAAFPDYDIYLGFTSNIIRNIWHERAEDADFRRGHPEIPEELYAVTNVFSALAAAQEDGFRPVLVQSLHITDGEEYEDVKNLASLLGEYKTVKDWRKPFPAIGVGEPALGVGDGGGEAYLERAAAALRELADKARAENAALVLMAHGNDHREQAVFSRFEATLRGIYGPHIFIGGVEGQTPVTTVLETVRNTPGVPKNVLLAPMMVVAGDHALNDMAGGEADSWKSLFQAAGFTVETHLIGLGSNASWADIYVEHLRELEKKIVPDKK